MDNKTKDKGADKGRMAVGICVIIILVLIICLQNLSENELTLWQTEEDIADQSRALRMKQEELQKALNRTEQLRLMREAFSKDSMDYWLVERDGQVEGNIQRIVGDIGTASEIKLSTLTNLTNEKIEEGVNLYRFTISSETNMEALAKFMDGIRKAKPKFFWQSCSIMPKSRKGSDMVRLKGALNFLSISDKKLIKVLTK